MALGRDGGKENNKGKSCVTKRAAERQCMLWTRKLTVVWAGFDLYALLKHQLQVPNSQKNIPNLAGHSKCSLSNEIVTEMTRCNGSKDTKKFN